MNLRSWRYVPAVLLLGLGLALAALFLAMAVPNARIAANLLRSANLHEEGGVLYSTPLSRDARAQRVPVSDVECTQLALGVRADQGSLAGLWSGVVRAPTTLYCRDLHPMLRGEPIAVERYERYWHGYTVVTRPVLGLVAYSTLQQLVAFTVLACCAIAVLAFARAAGAHAALGLLVPVLFVGTDWTSRISGAPVWVVAACGVVAVALGFTRARSTAFHITLFCVLGALTSYLDLLTTPVVTFALPAAALLWLCTSSRKAGRPAEWTLLVGVAVAWCIGYFGFWALKFLLVFLDGGWAAMRTIIETAATRLHGTVDGQRIGFGAATARNLSMIAGHLTLLWAAILAAAWMHPSKRHLFDAARRSHALLSLTFVPLVWWEVMANHSYIHASFTSLGGFLSALPAAVLVAGTWRAEASHGSRTDVPRQASPQEPAQADTR